MPFINVPETQTPILECRVVNYLTTCITCKGYIASSDDSMTMRIRRDRGKKPAYIRLSGILVDQTVETTGNHPQCIWCSWWDFDRSENMCYLTTIC